MNTCVNASIIKPRDTSQNVINRKGEIKMLTLKNLNTNQTWNFETKAQASEFIHNMSLSFEWQLVDNSKNEVIASHIYE